MGTVFIRIDDQEETALPNLPDALPMGRAMGVDGQSREWFLGYDHRLQDPTVAIIKLVRDRPEYHLDARYVDMEKVFTLAEGGRESVRFNNQVIDCRHEAHG